MNYTEIIEPVKLSVKSFLRPGHVSAVTSRRIIGTFPDLSTAMAKFLLTDESSWITGQIIGVDGGRSKLT